MGKPRQIDSETIILAIAAGKTEVVEELYARYRSDFLRWASKRFDAPRQDFEDAWQEAIVAFYSQVVSGRLLALQHELRCWLFAVGFRSLLNGKRKMKRILWKDGDDLIARSDAILIATHPIDVHRDHGNREILQTAMRAMSAQCREMLVQRYFCEKSIAEIQEEWQHSSANTTSAMLSRCLKRLKDLIQTARTAKTPKPA